MQSPESSTSYALADPRFGQIKMPVASSRILYDIPCRVCRDHSSGKHYGIFACDGCAGFFKRSIRRNRKYACKAKTEGACIVDKTHRNQCRACRLAKCVEAGMNKDAVQHERGPRNSTLRRQMALYFKDDVRTELLITQPPPNPILQHHHHHIRHNPHHQTVLDLALPKPPPNTVPVLQPFPIPLAPPSAEQVCESAATLLLMNVKWAKNVPAFASLAMPDQLLLIEDSWRELFILGAAHLLPPIDLVQLLHAGTGAFIKDTEKSLVLMHEVKVFQETLSRFSQLRVDPHEFSCLRAIVLFKTSFDSTSSGSSSSSSTGGSPSSDGEPARALQDGSAIAALQDHTQLALNKYIATAYAGQPLRFGKLLLLLPELRSVSGHTIEELFFRRTIGNIPIEKIICDMYKAETYLMSY